MRHSIACERHIFIKASTPSLPCLYTPLHAECACDAIADYINSSVALYRRLSTSSARRSMSLDTQKRSVDRGKRIQREAALSAHHANDRALLLLSGYAGGVYIQQYRPAPLKCWIVSELCQSCWHGAAKAASWFECCICEHTQWPST